MNHVSLVGRVSKEPELRYSTDGKAYVNFSIATDEPNYNGQERTTFIDVVVFGKAAETHAQNITKGLMISIQGRISTGTRERSVNGSTIKVPTFNVIASEIRYLETRGQVEQRQQNRKNTLPFGV